MGQVKRSVAERWVRYTDRTGGADACWPWIGAIKNNGYGCLTDWPRSLSAHRVTYELHIGPIPTGLSICHTCDNRRCCNPRHLFVGTVGDNNRDCHQKHRNPGNRKLTRANVDAIRLSHAAQPLPYRVLATQYGVTAAQIGHVIRHRHWH